MVNRTNDARHFHELRMRLVDCARTLRNAKDNYEQVKAQREQFAIDNDYANGKNAEERERKLIIFCGKDEECFVALARLQAAEYDYDRASELLEATKDERRAAEWQIRARLADALFTRGVQTDEDAAGDAAFDDAPDDEAMRNFAGALSHLDPDPDDFPF